MTQYRYLKHGEIIKATDEYDACNDGWRDDPVWKPVKTRIGQPAPDPQYPAHTIYRRRLTLYERFHRWLTWAAVDDACAPEGWIPRYKKLARRWLPTP